MFLLLLLYVTARSAGRWGARRWLTYHRCAVITLVLVWFHGVLAGSDTAALRWLYVATGATAIFLTTSRYIALRRVRVAELTPTSPTWELDDSHVDGARGTVAS